MKKFLEVSIEEFLKEILEEALNVSLSILSFREIFGGSPCEISGGSSCEISRCLEECLKISREKNIKLKDFLNKSVK